MNTTLALIAFAFSGIAVHYLKDWSIANNQGMTYNLKKAIPTILLSIVTSVLLVITRDSFKDLYVVTPFAAIILGYLGDSVFFSFVDVKKPKT